MIFSKMGMNYYTRIKDPCPTCGHGSEDLHIGKSSYGWKFLFHQHKELGLVSARAWREYLKDRLIVDEDEQPVDTDSFWELIESKQETGYTMATYAREGRSGSTFQSFSCIDECEFIDPDGYRICLFDDFA